jgi:hypothetical protein
VISDGLAVEGQRVPAILFDLLGERRHRLRRVAIEVHRPGCHGGIMPEPGDGRHPIP